MESAPDLDTEGLQSASPADSGNELDGEMPEHQTIRNGNGKANNGSSSNAKDPNRPRRKKARRACYACQRAHLTCGDERPCQRCIKRGLADVCQDGVRKKAKYLHDAPNEALLPGAATSFSQPEFKSHSSVSQTEQPQTPYFQSPHNYSIFGNQGTQMPPPSMQERNHSFSQASVTSAPFNISPALQSPTSTRDHQAVSALPANSWGPALFGAEDPSLFNFDLASMNFGNHYGALEFGMLGQMATGAGDTPDSETATQRGSIPGHFHVPLGSISESAPFPYGDGMMGDWNSGTGVYNHLSQKQNGPNAFAIESTVAFTSPEVRNLTPEITKHEESPTQQMHVPRSNHQSQQLSAGLLPLSTQDTGVKPPPRISTPQLKAKSLASMKSTKRPRDPSSIYTSVDSPYPYTTGFHSLIAYLQKRFSTSPSKTLAIAKSLASIRPSFIATTKTLNREDLIFMEKCFQRTLWEYEGFIEGVGTPTIVARRTGEIAAVGKEFQILTGWKKNILLGREPNLNVNRGHSGNTEPGSGANTTGRVTGTSTPALRLFESEVSDRQQPVFLAELLDDDSVVQFYEDFARLAFGDSRGSVMGKGKLLKYRTKDDEIAANLRAEAEARGEAPERPELRRTDTFAQTQPQAAKKGISGEKGMQKLGSSDGKVDCAYCWTVKRDVFDIPMLIVMNFLPCI